jgi:hypothetical protein
MTPIFRWSGEYFGFTSGDCLFGATSTYFAWIEHGRVWRSDGLYVGEIVDENYVLRNSSMVAPAPRVPRIPPVPPIPPVPSINRVGRIPRIGWTDALGDL